MGLWFGSVQWAIRVIRRQSGEQGSDAEQGHGQTGGSSEEDLTFEKVK